ncbi:hypothetical protein G5S35_23550 [Paraburkholderia tropica]|uniref:hypothetical protein n=1 Tax=Paraburkholderia tropica TaxID=92647 RepID=UPI0016049B7E|nr:hypothetical protein [Paraburkholderia tropica]QNB14654.1 hypothetical protein G5S35_23550 [Paraburkholderia tropica]
MEFATQSEPSLIEVFHLPIWAQGTAAALSGIMKITVGIGILRALRWARSLYVVAFVFEIAVAVMDYPPSLYQLLIPSFLISCVVLYLLFRKSSSQYFQRKPAIQIS